MSKICIFSDKKLCNDCGECDVCDLNRNKKCNNCGECLENPGYDSTAIKIDEIVDEDIIEEDTEVTTDTLDDSTDEDFNDEKLELIDDIDGLSEMLNDEKLLGKMAVEEFPGLIRIKKDNF